MLQPTHWKRLITRTSAWTPSRYAPFRVALNAQEKRRLERDRALLIGWIPTEHTQELTERFSELFRVDDDQRGVLMHPVFESVEDRTAAFFTMSKTLRDDGAFPMWRNGEQYAAKRFFRDEPLFRFQRGIGARFGLSEFATHLNGFTRDANTGRVDKMWIATRKKHKKSWPGRLDTIVGGGLPADGSALENMLKEAQEEAGLAPDWTRPRMLPSGSISYLLDSPHGLDNNMLFVYDLEMPLGMTPLNEDGQVEKFELWEIAEVLEALRDEPELFKPDICLVILDFCVRHGILNADNCDDLEQLVRMLHGAPSPFEEM